MRKGLALAMVVEKVAILALAAKTAAEGRRSWRNAGQR
jgi:hypothetical protein